MLELKISKVYWYADMYPIHKNTAYVSIGYSVLMLQSISRKVRDMMIPRIVPNINILVYLVPYLPVSSNIFLQQKLTHVILKSTNTFEEINNNNQKN